MSKNLYYVSDDAQQRGKPTQEFLTGKAFFPRLQPSSKQPGMDGTNGTAAGRSPLQFLDITCLPAAARPTFQKAERGSILDLRACSPLRGTGLRRWCYGKPAGQVGWGPSSPCPTVCHSANRHGCVPINIYKTRQKQVVIYTFHPRSMPL